MRLEPTDRGDLVAADLVGDRPYPVDDPRRGEQRIASQPHRRRAGVSRPTGQDELGPRDPLDPLDHPDRHTLVLQDRSLLDVEFDERVGKGSDRTCCPA
ncbi:MAG: hypothetical protein R2697_16240 [Ilumatobacteraceae bacterium]